MCRHSSLYESIKTFSNYSLCLLNREAVTITLAFKSFNNMLPLFSLIISSNLATSYLDLYNYWTRLAFSPNNDSAIFSNILSTYSNSSPVAKDNANIPPIDVPMKQSKWSIIFPPNYFSNYFRISVYTTPFTPPPSSDSTLYRLSWRLESNVNYIFTEI